MKKTFLYLSVFLFSVASAQAAVSIGDIILINFTKTGNTVGGNWNDFESGGGANIATGPTTTELFADLIRSSDGANTGLSLSLINVGNWGIGGADFTADSDIAFPESGTIPDNAQENLTYHSEGDQFRFSALDDSLTYNLSILSANPNDRNAHDWIVNEGGSNEVSLSVDPNPGGVFTFSNIGTDGSGNITLTNTSSSGADGQHINAMELVAIPEPGTLALVGIALGSLLLFRCRK